MRVRDVMSHPVITVAPTTEAAIAARVLYSHGFTALPVVDDGRLVGIVSIGDVVKNRMEELQAEQAQLQAYITQGG